jgi:hypothetical protein
LPYPIPAIVYDPGTGPVTLAPALPNINKPGSNDGNDDERSAERSDSITSSGIVQAVIERVDIFRTVQFDWVPISDLPAWALWADYATQGGKFSYYPDSNSTAHEDWILDDKQWKPQRAHIGYAKFSLNLRLAVGDSGTISGVLGGGAGTGTITTVDVTAPGAGDFDWPHGVTGTILAAIPVPTSAGLLRLQDPGWDGTNIHLNASAAGVTGVVYVFS